MGDLAGYDIGWASRKRRAAENPERTASSRSPTGSASSAASARRPAPAGIATKGDRTPHPDPIVANIIREEAEKLGNAPRTFTDRRSCAGCCSPR
jgi:3-hydroxyacyl-CoA dehydrogenase